MSRLVAILSLFVCAASFAADTAADFDAGNKLYEQGKFSEAASAYEKMLADGRSSAAVWFNLGNARFKTGQFGHAIAAYRQAEVLAPRDAEVRANLQFVRNKVAGMMADDLPPWRRALELVSLNEWTLLVALAFWVLFAALALGQWRPQKKSSLRSLTVSCAAVFVVGAACLVASLALRYGRPTAVVTVSEAVVRYGPVEESKTFFTLRDGAEVRIIGQKDDWVQVLDSSQRAGWVKRAQVMVFPPEKRG